MWSCATFDTMTGLVGMPIDIPSASWKITVSDSSLATTRDKGVGADEGSSIHVPWAAIPTDDAGTRDKAVAVLRRGLCLMWDGAPVVAGAIGTRTDSWEDTTFALVSPLGVLKNRVICGEGKFGTDAGSTSQGQDAYRNLSYRAIAASIIKGALAKEGGQLPIDVDHYIGETGSHERTYNYFNAANNLVSKRLEEIANISGGPDMQFRPYLATEQYLRWRFVAGSDASPYLDQSGNPPTLTCFAGGGTLQEVTVAHLSPAMRVYGTGSGDDKATLCYLAQDLSLCRRRDPWPLVEATASNSSDWSTAALVQKHTKAALEAAKTPLIQIKGKVDISDPSCPVVPGQFWPGQYLFVDIDGFPSLPDGRYKLRLMEMSGDLSTQVTLIFDQIEDPWEGGVVL